MSNLFTEDALIEQPAIRLFKDVLEWQTVNCYDETFGANGTLGREHRGEVVLVSRLRPALEKLNPALPSIAIELAITEIIRDRSTLPLIVANQDVYKLIKDGVKVKFKDEQGKNREETVRVMEWDKPAPTMTTQCYGFGNGRFGHPEQDRAISLREAAILQSFPRDYAFVPDDGEVSFKVLGRLIGNAVPVDLGRAIARSINTHIASVTAR